MYHSTSLQHSFAFSSYRVSIKVLVLLSLLLLISSCGSSSNNNDSSRLVPPPSNFQISEVHDAGLTLSWDRVEGASTYTLYYQLGEDLSTASAATTETKQTSIVLKNLTNYSTYSLAVSASNPYGESDLSAVIQERAGIRLSAAPSNFQISEVHDAGLTLSWDRVEGASTYTLYYQLGEDFSVASAATTETKQTSIVLKNLINYSTYTVAVSASNLFGSSGLSASLQERAGVRLTEAPENFVASSSEDIPNTIQLSWSELTGATTYRIYYQLVDNSTSATSTDTSSTKISLSNLVTGRVYSFQIQGINPVSESALSAIIQEEGFPLIVTPIQGQQTLAFSWGEVDDVDYYRLLSDLGTGGGFEDASTKGFVMSPSSTYLKQTTATARLGLHQYVPLTNDPQYRLEGCSEESDSCDEEIGTAVVDQQALNQLIGYIKASNTGQFDEFGFSIALSNDGNTLAVGAPNEDGSGRGVNPSANNSLSNGGAVYVYTRENGIWSDQITYIKASNTGEFELFGSSVALSGDGNIMAVGARFEDGSGRGINPTANDSMRGAGAVYVYTRKDGSWNDDITYIKASNPGRDDWFGQSVALSDDGNTLAVGAPYENGTGSGINPSANDNLINSGAVYVYSRENGSWSTQVTYIKASNAGEEDGFGWSVALSGDGNTLAVGAYREEGSGSGINPADNNDLANSGAVYVYSRESGIWSDDITYIKAINPGEEDLFGWSVALSGDGNTLAVGAYQEDGSGRGINPAANNNLSASGAAYVYSRENGIWSDDITYIKASNTGEVDRFGWSVSLSGDGNTLAVGAYQEDGSGRGINPAANNNLLASGAAYVYSRENGSWSDRITYIKASNTGEIEFFGSSFALSGDGNIMAVGARVENGSGRGINPAANNNARDSGAVYLY